jgi:hypothetical protein
MFGALMVGVLLTGLSVRAIADQVHVTARIPAPPLTQAATITSPTDGQIIRTSPITVTGFCPDDSYINLYRNGMFSGAAVCVNHTYGITTDLFEGRNTLLVQAFNVTDDAGPATPPIDVTYIPPASGGSTADQYIPTAPGSSDQGAQQQIGPLLLWSDYRFSVFTTKEDFTWKISLQSGKPPFSVNVNWGDGSVTQLKITGHDEFEISHRYANPGYYPILVAASDSSGDTAHLQLIALIKLPGALGTIGSIISGRGDPSTISVPDFHWLFVAWPIYTVIALMILSFWLGERREFLQLTGRYQHRRRHA